MTTFVAATAGTPMISDHGATHPIVRIGAAISMHTGAPAVALRVGVDEPAELWPCEAHHLAEVLVTAAFDTGWRPDASAPPGTDVGPSQRPERGHLDERYDPEDDLRRRHPGWSIDTTDGLPFGVAAAVDLSRRVIEVAVGLTRAERRSTLAHEVVHVDLGHHGHQPAYVEHLVDAIAASRLFTPSEFENARARGNGRSHDVARRLGVDHATVLAWARTRTAVQNPDELEGA